MSTAIEHPYKHQFFDTHAFIKRLVKAGFTEQQAEVLAEEQADLVENKLATKKDIAELRRATEKDISLLKKDLIIAMGSIMTVGIGVLGVLKYFG